jgi:hypothetical protein
MIKEALKKIKQKRMKILFIIFIVTILFSCKSNYTRIGDKDANYIPYYLKTYEADSLYLTGNYEKSYKILDSLFKKYEPINSKFTNEYLNYIELKIKLEKKISKDEVLQLISKHGYIKDVIIYNKTFNNFDKKNNFYITNNYDIARKIYISSIDLVLRDTIRVMKLNDQKNRRTNSNQEKFDLINQNKIKLMFENNIYPNEKMVGNFTVDNQFIDFEIILLHSRDSMRMNYFLPKVLNFIKIGKAEPTIYGNMIDQQHLYRGVKQIYGTYNIDNIKSNDYNIYNSKRKSIGLPTINYTKWKDSIMKSEY